MAGELALDSSAAVRFLNGDDSAVKAIRQATSVILPLPVVGELIYGAARSGQRFRNLERYEQFITRIGTVPLTETTAREYARVKLGLADKGRPIPENDVWIAAQCIEHGWMLLNDDRHFLAIEGLKRAQLRDLSTTP